MAQPEVFGAVAGFIVGQAQQFIRRQQDLTRKNQNIFFSDLARSAIIGNRERFEGDAGVDTLKNFLKMGGTEEVFSAFTKTATAPTTVASRSASLAAFDAQEAESAEAKEKALAGEAQQQIRRSTFGEISEGPGVETPAEIAQVFGAPTGAVAGQALASKRQAELEQQRIDIAKGTLTETIAAGKSERLLRKNLRKVRDLEIKRATSQLRGNIAIRSGDEFGLSAGQGETYARFIMKELEGSLPPAIASKVGVDGKAIAKSVQDSIKERDKGIVMLQKLSEADNPLAKAAMDKEGVPAFESKAREANSFIARHFLNMVQKGFLTQEEAQAQFDILAAFPDVDIGTGVFNLDRPGLLISIEEAKRQNIPEALDLTIESFLTPLPGEERTPEEEAFLERQAPLGGGGATPELGLPGGS